MGRSYRETMLATYDDYDRDDFEDSYEGEDGYEVFADPGGRSALRAASADNPRNLPCPTCDWPNRLTPRDVELGYQCDQCADACEGMGEIDYYEPPEPLTGEALEKRIRGAFEGLYKPFAPTVSVDGAGTDYIRVTVTIRGSNASMDFSCRVPSDDDGKLYFYHDATDTTVTVPYMDR